MLHRLIYRSEDRLGCSDHAAELADLVGCAERVNRRNHVTGVLVYRPGRFLQIIEGSRISVETTFERICRDRRHHRLALLEFISIDRRHFGHWPMALALARPDAGIGTDVIDMALGGIASEGGSQALVDGVLSALAQEHAAAA